MEQWMKDQIKYQADHIRDKLRGGKLFGTPIDFDDPDMMIVAAYWLADAERATWTTDQIELAESIKL